MLTAHVHANTHNTTKYKNSLQKQKHTANTHITTKYRNALQVAQNTMEPLQKLSMVLLLQIKIKKPSVNL